MFIIQMKNFYEQINKRGNRKDEIKMLDKLALLLVIIGALNWGSIGIFAFDIVAWIFGGQDALVSRIIYTLVGLVGIWCISLFFRKNDVLESRD